MMALAGVELETLVSEPDALTTLLLGRQQGSVCLWPDFRARLCSLSKIYC